MDPQLEARLIVMERELDRLLATQNDDATFRAEMRQYIAEQKALGPTYTKRLEAVEESVKELEAFKAKILGAVAVAGVLGGTAGSVAAALFRLLG